MYIFLLDQGQLHAKMQLGVLRQQLKLRPCNSSTALRALISWVKESTLRALTSRPLLLLLVNWTYACILKAHSHSMSGGSIWASLACVSMLFLNSWRVSVVHYYMCLLTIQLFKGSIDTWEKLRLNLHSLSVSELLEYRHISCTGISGLQVWFLAEGV
jgi:hypothetical protein